MIASLDQSLNGLRRNNNNGTVSKSTQPVVVIAVLDKAEMISPNIPPTKETRVRMIPVGRSDWSPPASPICPSDWMIVQTTP